MEIFEDPAFKTKYLKNKLRVKLWQSDFMDKYGRKPNKNDIKEADVSIKEAYKIYWKLKTHALEEILTDITLCDDVQSNVSNGSPRKSTNDQRHNKNSSPQKIMKDAENMDPHNSECSVETVDFTNTSNMSNIEGTWGEHLNRNKREASPKKKQTLLIGRSSSFQLSRTKFESSAFVKRNPRKSLSSTKLKTKSEKSILSSLSIDHAESDNKSGCNESEETKSMFGESMKVTFENSKLVSHSVNAVQQLADGHVTSMSQAHSRNLNQGWLDRCARNSNLEMPTTFNPQRLSNTSDSGVESMESTKVYSPKNSLPATSLRISDEEDFICNSDSEEERRNKRVRNFRKHLSDRDSRAAKRRCVDVDQNSAIQSAILRPSDATDINTNFNLVKYNGTKIDCTSTSKLIADIKASSNLLDEPVRTENDEVTNITANLRAELNVAVEDEAITKNICQGKVNQTKNEPRMMDATSNSTDLTNRKDFTILDEKLVKQCMPTHTCARRRTKQVLSDDSDPDYAEENEKNTKIKAKKNTTRSIKSSAVRRNKKRTKNTEGKFGLKGKSSERKSTLKQSDEKKNSDAKTEKIPVYGVETIQTIPRFAMRSTETADLIAQFTESVSAIDKSEKDASMKETVMRRTTKLTGKEKLEKKIATGTMNDNFVRINLKKKVFVRGKKNFNLSKYKKNQWKQRKKELASSESNLDAADFIDKNGTTACFKCGESGHFAKNCIASKGDALLPLEEIDELSSNFPTLEEAEKMARENAIIAHSHRLDRLPQRSSSSVTKASCSQNEEDLTEFFNDNFADSAENNTFTIGHKIPQELLSRLLPPRMEVVDPLYSLKKENGDLIETPKEVFDALRMFGHKSFKTGQEKAVMRILSGQSTLVTLSTGSGKSLCYQLPAYLYSQHFRCITLVISPLVSLMDDQVMDVPLFLSAACLHTSQSVRVRERVMESVKNGKVNILLVSPEAVVAGEKSTGFGALFRQLPPIAFACIDEAHCISQWSHNFRPSYLMVCRVLKEKLGVRTVLGLTATATRATAESIVKHLDLHDGMAGIISDVPVPRNLVLTVSKDGNKDQALIALLKSERFRECHSVIIYCTRREECTRIAGLLRISLQDPANPEKPDAKVSSTAEAYHAGMTAYRRKIVQKQFMSGKIRIVVATVAFGMGINKSDIRAIIHYNMPGTFEGYVQEIGRAGRDGLMAHCHLFLNPTQDTDKWELRRHIYANGVDRHTIRHLLQKIFIPCSCAKINEKNFGRRCPGHEVALPIEEIVQTLDITEESISTLLCYLELHPKRLITVLSSVYVRARVSSYNGPEALKRAAQSSPPLAMAIALDMQKRISHENSNIIQFSVIDVASAIGWDSGVVKSHLKSLEWTTTNDGKVKRSYISVHYDRLGLRVKAPGDLTDSELDEALDALIARTQSQESSCLSQLEIIFSALNETSVSSIKHCSILDDDVEKRSEMLKNTIRKYFQSDSSLNNIDMNLQDKVANEQQIAADVRSLIMCYRDTKFTGRAVARIFHGIQSPNYPAIIWGRCRFWRAHLAANFNGICKIATKEILALR